MHLTICFRDVRSTKYESFSTGSQLLNNIDHHHHLLPSEDMKGTRYTLHLDMLTN